MFMCGGCVVMLHLSPITFDIANEFFVIRLYNKSCVGFTLIYDVMT